MAPLKGSGVFCLYSLYCLSLLLSLNRKFRGFCSPESYWGGGGGGWFRILTLNPLEYASRVQECPHFLDYKFHFIVTRFPKYWKFAKSISGHTFITPTENVQFSDLPNPLPCGRRKCMISERKSSFFQRSSYIFKYKTIIPSAAIRPK